MIIISEKLNSSIPSVKKIFDSDNENALKALIAEQYEAGAAMFDVNTAMCADEVETGKKAIDDVILSTDAGIVVDSPSVDVTKKLLEYINGRVDTIINSVSLSERSENIDLALKFNSGIIVMLTDENGIPDTAEKRFANAESMIKKLNEKGIKNDMIYIDPIIETVAVNDCAASTALETIAMIKKEFPAVHITSGASNVSFGLPKRKIINAAFIALAAYFGMDAPICDVAADGIKGAILASEVIAGKDEFCMNYIEEFAGG